MTCGIYAIVCDKTWRSYVGQSVNIERRIQDHFQNMRRGDANKEILADFQMYGEDSFSWEILEIVDNTDLLIERERYWSEFGCNLYSKPVGFNELPQLTERQIKNFWDKVNKTEDINECWEFTGMIVGGGYGRVKLNSRPKTAHRIAFFLANPEEDHNSVICHKCNNRKCCNPNHLYAGTIQDNSKDIFLGGRRGKLTWEYVAKIREKIKEDPNISGRILHEWFFDNVAPLTFNREYLVDVAMNIKWVDKNYIPPERNARKLDFEKAEEIRQLSKDGLSYGKIIQIFINKYNTSINPATISNIINNKLYRREQYGHMDLLNECP